MRSIKLYLKSRGLACSPPRIVFCFSSFVFHVKNVLGCEPQASPSPNWQLQNIWNFEVNLLLACFTLRISCLSIRYSAKTLLSLKQVENDEAIHM